MSQFSTFPVLCNCNHHLSCPELILPCRPGTHAHATTPCSPAAGDPRTLCVWMLLPQGPPTSELVHCGGAYPPRGMPSQPRALWLGSILSSSKKMLSLYVRGGRTFTKETDEPSEPSRDGNDSPFSPVKPSPPCLSAPVFAPKRILNQRHYSKLGGRKSILESGKQFDLLSSRWVVLSHREAHVHVLSRGAAPDAGGVKGSNVRLLTHLTHGNIFKIL